MLLEGSLIKKEFSLDFATHPKFRSMWNFGAPRLENQGWVFLIHCRLKCYLLGIG
jgi:hypothetical protein